MPTDGPWDIGGHGLGARLDMHYHFSFGSDEWCRASAIFGKCLQEAFHWKETPQRHQLHKVTRCWLLLIITDVSTLPKQEMLPHWYLCHTT